MRRIVLVAALGALGLAAVPGTVDAGGFELRAGAFFPRADSNLFDDTEELFGTEKSDWVGFQWGGEYSFGLTRHVELGFHVDGYTRTLDTSYVDFTRPSGQEIFQTLNLDIIPAGATVRYVVNPGRGEITPYVGVGADAVFYEYEEFGDFIDFFNDNLPVRS